MIYKKQKEMFVLVCILIALFAFLGVPPGATFIQAAYYATQRAIQIPDLTLKSEDAKLSHYEIVVKTCSWSEAKVYAETYAPEKESHLAVITTEEEWQTVEKMLEDRFEEQKAYVWLGAFSDDNGDFHWINDEEFDYAPWSAGEPSYRDQDGTRESCLCAWNVRGSWNWNDQRDELPTVLTNPDGKIAMVIEYYE